MAEQKSNRVFLLVAVVLGVLATVTTFAYLESSASFDRAPKRKIYVASRDLSPNYTLDPAKDLLELDIPIQMTGLYDRCLKPEFKESYKNQRVNRKILAGTPVMNADLAVPLADLELRPGKVALALPVKGAHAVSGLLVPGDLVKVFVTRPLSRTRTAGPPPAVGDEPAATLEPMNRWETVLISPEPLRVLAVGGRLSRTRLQLSAAEQFESAHEPEGQQAVTVEVTEAQAKSILQETGAGTLPITLVLHEKGNPTTAPR